DHAAFHRRPDGRQLWRAGDEIFLPVLLYAEHLARAGRKRSGNGKKRAPYDSHADLPVRVPHLLAAVYPACIRCHRRSLCGLSCILAVRHDAYGTVCLEREMAESACLMETLNPDLRSICILKISTMLLI